MKNSNNNTGNDDHHRSYSKDDGNTKNSSHHHNQNKINGKYQAKRPFRIRESCRASHRRMPQLLILMYKTLHRVARGSPKCLTVATTGYIRALVFPY